MYISANCISANCITSHCFTFLPQHRQRFSDDKKFQKGLKEHRDSDMKQFLAQQKSDLKSTKTAYKRVLDDDQNLTSSQRKHMLEDRKKEVQTQLKVNEEEHLASLKSVAAQQLVDYRQSMMQERQTFEKGLVQEVSHESRVVLKSFIGVCAWLCTCMCR